VRVLHQISAGTPAYLIRSCSPLGACEGPESAAERRGAPPYDLRAARDNPRAARRALTIDSATVLAIELGAPDCTPLHGSRAGQSVADQKRPKSVTARPKIVTAQLDIFSATAKKIWTLPPHSC
jgi:hypothetical protein